MESDCRYQVGRATEIDGHCLWRQRLRIQSPTQLEDNKAALAVPRPWSSLKVCHTLLVPQGAIYATGRLLSQPTSSFSVKRQCQQIHRRHIRGKSLPLLHSSAVTLARHSQAVSGFLRLVWQSGKRSYHLHSDSLKGKLRTVKQRQALRPRSTGLGFGAPSLHPFNNATKH